MSLICKCVSSIWRLVLNASMWCMYVIWCLRPCNCVRLRQTDMLTGRTLMWLPSWMQMETSSTETLSTLPLPRPLPPHPGPYFSFSLSVSFSTSLTRVVCVHAVLVGRGVPNSLMHASVARCTLGVEQLDRLGGSASFTEPIQTPNT